GRPGGSAHPRAAGVGKRQERIAQVAWVIDHLADLESDFSRFHRIDDIYALDGPRFMRLAWRIGVYEGVSGMRRGGQADAARPLSPSPHRAAPFAPSSRSGAEIKPVAAMAPVHPDMFDVRRKAR